MMGCLFLVALGLSLCLFALALLGVLGALTMIIYPGWSSWSWTSSPSLKS
jgi:hypothetical protein